MKFSSNRLAMRLGVAFLILAWLGMTIGGLVALWAYETSPGEFGAAPPHWPTASKLVHSVDQPTLLLFAHPKCPCTQASLTELARLLTASGERCNARIVFNIPVDKPQWAQSDLCQRAQQIAGAKVVFDIGGVETRNFGAATSGHVLLYDGAGQLLFSGGITPARGQTGASRGAQALAAQLRSPEAGILESNVLGCALLDSARSGGDPCPKP